MGIPSDAPATAGNQLAEIKTGCTSGLAARRFAMPHKRLDFPEPALPRTKIAPEVSSRLINKLASRSSTSRSTNRAYDPTGAGSASKVLPRAAVNLPDRRTTVSAVSRAAMSDSVWRFSTASRTSDNVCDSSRVRRSNSLEDTTTASPSLRLPQAAVVLASRRTADSSPETSSESGGDPCRHSVTLRLRRKRSVHSDDSSTASRRRRSRVAGLRRSPATSLSVATTASRAASASFVPSDDHSRPSKASETLLASAATRPTSGRPRTASTNACRSPCRRARPLCIQYAAALSPLRLRVIASI